MVISAPISRYNVFPILGKCSPAVSTRQTLICADKSLYICRNRTLLLLFKADDARSNKLVEAMIEQNEQDRICRVPVRHTFGKASIWTNQNG